MHTAVSVIMISVVRLSVIAPHSPDQKIFSCLKKLKKTPLDVPLGEILVKPALSGGIVIKA
jgi:hypothetical protein